MRFFRQYVLLLFILIHSCGIFAQKYNLKLSAKDIENQSVLDSFFYKKRNLSKDQIIIEISKALDSLKFKGYFTARVLETTTKGDLFEALIKLGKKTNFINVNIPSNLFTALENQNQQSKIQIEKIEEFKKGIKDKLLEKGIPFSEISFANYKYVESNLFADLIVTQTKKRKIDKVIFIGYENFPTSFRKNYLKLINSEFNSNMFEDIEQKINELSFVKTTKTPEILFKKDSTILYVYAKKITNSSIDAMVNINTNESSSLQLNGIVDLSLNNVLNFGEKFMIYWNRVGADQSEFKIQSNMPYLFQTKTSADVSFGIYRQDSTFLNTNANLLLSYPIKNLINTGGFISVTSSNQINDNLNNVDISDFNSFFIGGFIETISKKKSFSGKRKFVQRYELSFGKRTNDNLNTNQVLFNSNLRFRIDISKRSLIYLNNSSKLLLSKDYLQNEIFRIGGIHSIRGFNEQSIFSSKYSILNSEFRFYTSSVNFFHSITDLAWTQDINNFNTNLYSLGLGYSFLKNNSQINLAYVIGGEMNNSLDLNNSRLIVKFITFF